jgi:hypothetical protein
MIWNLQIIKLIYYLPLITNNIQPRVATLEYAWQQCQKKFCQKGFFFDIRDQRYQVIKKNFAQ